MADYKMVSFRRLTLLTDKPHIYKQGGEWQVNKAEWSIFKPNRSGLHRHFMNAEATNFCHSMNKKEGNQK